MKRLTLLVVLLTTPAFAQQQPDPDAARSDNRISAEQARKIAVSQPQQPDQAILQRVIPSLQQQRNVAMDATALAEARAAQLAEEVAKLKARVDELEKAAK